MKWIDDAPDSWEQAPEDPPTATDPEIAADEYPDGVLVHEPGSEGAFIYARGEELTIEEAA